MAAAVLRADLVSRKLFLLAAGQEVPSFAESRCTGQQECAQQGTSWTSLWYVWLILLTVFLLLICGIGASCVKFCCRKKRPPVQTFPPHTHDLTIVPVDPDSTAHSTVISYSSLQYPQNFSLPLPFREVDRSMASPPAYSLYAIEMPPSYDEAIRMAKPYVETLFGGQKMGDNATEPATQEVANEPQALPESLHGSPEMIPESSEALDSSTPGQPQP